MGAVYDLSSAISRLRVVFQGIGCEGPTALVLAHADMMMVEAAVVGDDSLSIVRDAAYEGREPTICGLKIRVEG